MSVEGPLGTLDSYKKNLFLQIGRLFFSLPSYSQSFYDLKKELIRDFLYIFAIFESINWSNVLKVSEFGMGEIVL